MRKQSSLEIIIRRGLPMILNSLAELWLGIHRQGNAKKSMKSWLINYQKEIFIMDTRVKNTIGMMFVNAEELAKLVIK